MDLPLPAAPSTATIRGGSSWRLQVRTPSRGATPTNPGKLTLGGVDAVDPHGDRAPSAATASAMAIRWSPPALARPPWSPPPAITRSSPSSAAGPRRGRGCPARAHRAGRSPSPGARPPRGTRNPPSVRRQRGEHGHLVDHQGELAGLDPHGRTPALGSTSIDPTGSPELRTLDVEPCDRSPSARITTGSCSTGRVETDASHRRSRASQRGRGDQERGRRRIARHPGRRNPRAGTASTVTRSPSRATGAPSASSGPLGVVAGRRRARHGRRPSAASPAKSTAPFTCALGTAGSEPDPVQRPAPIRTGDGRPRSLTSAPIARRGFGHPLHRPGRTGSRRR